MTKIFVQVLHFERPEREYLSENPYYQQHYVEEKARDAPESGVEIKICFPCFTIIFEGLTKISGYILNFEPERRHLSKFESKSLYQQLYAGKKAGNAAEGGVIYSVHSFVFCFK